MLGSFQDGGLRHNNPVDLALWECRKIWNSDTTPDVVLSLGTGTEEHPPSPKAPHFRHVFNDGFIPRLCRSFMTSLDGERAWRDLINRLDESTRDDYFRFNVPLSTEEPRIDDVGQMENLKNSVHLLPNGLEDRINAASALLIASFYFELQSFPRFDAGRYFCQGLIRCRNNGEAVLKSLASIHGGLLEFAGDTEVLGTLCQTDICDLCHLYCKKVKFFVRHLEDTVNIQVKFNGHVKRKISGFPHNMLWFIKQQQLDSAFGTSDHDMPGAIKCLACKSGFSLASKPNSGSKRRLDFPDNHRKRPKFSLNVVH